jgi:murein L,D-transpeptidase YcbB/YkuD
LLLALLALSCAEARKDQRTPRSAADIEKTQEELAERLTQIVETERAATEQRIKTICLGSLPWQLPLLRPELIEAELHQREAALLFVQANGLSPRANTLLQTLHKVEQHGLFPADFHLPAIEERRAMLASALPQAFSLSDEERAALRSWLQTRPSDAVESDLQLILDPEQSPIPTLQARLQQSLQQLQQRQALLAELELLLHDAVLEYAFTLSLHRLWGLPATVRTSLGAERIWRERALELFRQLRHEDIAVLLDRLQPKDHRYLALQTVLPKYQEIVAQGGWPTLELAPKEMPLRRGARADVVATLELRLAAEGYDPGERDGVFDNALAQSLKEYQRRHQLKDDGAVDEEVLHSLNKSAEHRLAEIENAMERIRDTRIGNEDYYVYINVPSFMGEVWKAEQRLHRFKVITGSASRYFAEDRQSYVYPNATPLISAEIDFLVFNPYWNVPPRIKRELDKHLAEDPNWYENNGYEVTRRGDSIVKVRQKPGNGNALGRVKFQFPNPYDVYLHDTPNKRTFKQEIRAYSHGCIRVHEPLELAKVLLENDGRSAVKWRIEQYLASQKQDWTSLDKKVPIHIEYIGVEVDAQGHAFFGADPYRLDAPRIKARMLRHGWLSEPEEGDQDDPTGDALN